MGYYINTNYDMHNEKDYFYHYKIVQHIQDFEELFLKTVGALLVFDVLDNNISSYFVDVNKNLLLVCFFGYI